MLLAGDVGGTKTLVAVYSREVGPYAPVAKAEVHSSDYGSLTAIAREFLTNVKLSVDQACFAVAGPVMDGRAKMLAFAKPLIASIALALSAMPVATRVVRDSLMAAACALISMSTECSGAATRDGIEHLRLWPGQGRTIAFAESVRRFAKRPRIR